MLKADRFSFSIKTREDFRIAYLSEYPDRRHLKDYLSTQVCAKMRISQVLFFWVFCSTMETLGSVEIVHPSTYSFQAQSGSSISVECVSQDGATLKWTHKGRLVSGEESRYSIGQLEYHRHAHKKSILTLSDVTEEDTGLITCMDAGNHTHSDDVTLQVAQANNIPVVEIVEPATDSVSVVAGSSLTFKCVSRAGNNLMWSHNGTPLHSSTHIIITEALSLDRTRRTNLLSSRRVSKADDGTYTCQEVGNYLNVDRVDVTVEEPSHGTAHVDIVEPPVSHITLQEGKPLQLKCTAGKHTHVQWLKDNVPLQDGVDGYIIAEDTDELFRTSVLSRQEVVMEVATYTCINQADLSEKDEVKVDYGDISEAEYQPPRQQDQVVIRMQSSVSLQCQMNARGDYHVVWAGVTGGVIESSEKYIISRSDHVSTLIIRNTDRHDIGQYRCSFIDKETGRTAGLVIYNVSGISCPPIDIPQNGIPLNCPQDAYVGDTCTVQCNGRSSNQMVGTTVSVCEREEMTEVVYWTDTGVHCTAPMTPIVESNIPSSLSHVLLRAHDPTRLHCAQTGRWVRNNRTLYSGEKYLIINSTLVIKNTVKEDSGEYTCVLYDNKGFLYGFKKFNVTYMHCRPLPLPRNAYITDCSESPVYGETCMFHCDTGYQMYGSQFSTCELLTPSETGTYWTSEPPHCSSRGDPGEYFGQESHAHSDLHLSYLSHVITLCVLQILYIVLPTS